MKMSFTLKSLFELEATKAESVFQGRSEMFYQTDCYFHCKLRAAPSENRDIVCSCISRTVPIQLNVRWKMRALCTSYRIPAF